MKKLLLGVLTLTSLSSFSSTCYVARSTGEDPTDYNVIVSTYENVQSSKENILTLIKKDGTVLNNFDIERYYEGAQTEDEMNARTREIEGSLVAAISLDEENGQLNLASGLIGSNSEDMLTSSVMSVHDIDSKTAALFDTKAKLAIFCVQ